MARVLVNGAADRDVDEIFETIGRASGFAVAAAYINGFDAFYRQIERFPESGSPRPSLGPGIRIGIVRPYVIIYLYDAGQDTVEILRILHGHRRMTASLLPGTPNT